jgi:hypothetical protein
MPLKPEGILWVLPIRQIMSTPSVTAVRNCFPSSPPLISAAASAAGTIDALACIVPGSKTSSKSTARAIMPLARAARKEGTFFPYWNSVLSSLPPHSRTWAATSGQPWAPVPASMAAKVSTTLFFVAATTRGGISSYRIFKRFLTNGTMASMSESFLKGPIQHFVENSKIGSHCGEAASNFLDVIGNKIASPRPQ